MTAEPRAVAAAYFDAWKANDPAALRALLADDATFAGPMGHAEGADELATAIQRLFSITKDVLIQQVTADDGDVMTWFDLYTTVAPPTAVVNWSRVRDGKIIRVLATFDPRDIIAGLSAQSG
ncbi:MAG TPA: nuclear transport factor 2 family protein [Streptosporangiaceae bacterium]